MAEIRKIGNFELLERIGQGGMGSVFKARQISMDRVVALKILPPTLAKQAKFIERFLREARASAKLNHPNIVSAIDVGQENGIYYFAMEFIEGCTVKPLLAKGPIREDRTLKIGHDIARALAHAHEHGILHRDVKPDNILIDNFGTPKLCDLGLAKQDSETDEEKHLTQQGQALGTPHYISPEQARGQRDLDAKVDLYALGATMYHMLTGQTMFKAATPVAIMTMHITDKAPHPADQGVQVSKGTVAILAKLLTKNRADRYESAARLTEDLERVMNGRAPVHAELAPSKSPFKNSSATGQQQTPVKKLPSVERGGRQRRETKSSGSVLAIAAIVVLIAGAGLYALYLNSQKPEPPANPPVAMATSLKPELPKTDPAKAPPKPAEITPPKPVAPVETTPEKPLVKPEPAAAPAESKPEPVEPRKPEKPDPKAEPKPEPEPAKAPEPVVIAQVPEPEPAKPEPVAKTEPGAEVQRLIDDALAFGKESKFKEAAEVFGLSASRLAKLDEFDKTMVKAHAAAYAGLSETKNLLIEKITREPNKHDAEAALGKRWQGKIAGADERAIHIGQQGVEMQLRWQNVSLADLRELASRLLGNVPPAGAFGMGVLAFDKKDDSTARACLQTVMTMPEAVWLLEQVDLRDKALAEKRANEKNAAARKLYLEIQSILTEGNLPRAALKAAVLKNGYASTEFYREKSAEIDGIIEASKLAVSAVVQPGNVAFIKNGTTTKGIVNSPNALIDGVISGYSGDKGFASGNFPCEWYVTLPKLYLLREIRVLLWDNEKRHYQYSIETSADGKNFTMLADRSKGKWRSWQILSFPPRPVKVIKVNGLYNSSNGGFHVVELEAYCIPSEEKPIPKFPSEAE